MQKKEKKVHAKIQHHHTVVADTASTLPQITVETKFNQGYRTASAVNGGGEIVSVCNRSGQVELFTLGTDGNIWNFYPDPTSDTGYTGVCTALASSTFAATVDNSGNIVVFGAIGLQLFYVTEINSKGARWSAPANVPLPGVNNGIAISKIVTERIGQAIYVGVLTNFRSAKTSYAFCYSQWNTSAPQFLSTPAVFGSLQCIWMGNNSNNAAIACCDGVFVKYTVASGQVDRFTMQNTFSCTGVATVLDQTGNNQVFAILGDGNINVLSGGGGVNPYYWTALSNGMMFRQVMVTKDMANNINVIAVTGSNQLCHWEPAQTQSGYSYPPATISTNVALAALCTNDNGNIDIFTIGTSTNSLNHLYQEEISGNWVAEKVEVPKAGSLEEYISYSTDVNALDSIGVPLVNSPVSLWAAEETKITVNGSTYYCGPNNPVSTSTNAAGVLAISQQAGSLAIPTIDIRFTNVMPPGQAITVQQNADVENRLANVKGTELMDAKDESGNYLIGDTYRTPTTTDSMASAFNQCMKISQTAKTNAMPFATRRGNKPGVFLKNNGHPADMLKVGYLDVEQHWQLVRRGGQLYYENLSAHEAASIIAMKRASIQSVNGVFDWLDDIGDFVAGVVDGIIDVVDNVITTVGNAINAAITFIVDGVTYLFETVVSFVEQAFDLVESIFAQVKVFFEKVWEWIGFLFSWNDILRTHDAISYTINQLIGFIDGSITGVQAIVDNGFDNFQKQIDTVFQNAIKNIAGSASIGGYSDANTPSDPNYDPSVSNNVVYNGIVDSGGSAVSLALKTKLAAADDPINDLLAQLTAFGTSAESSAAFANAVQYFNNLGGSPDQIFSQLLAGLLSVAEGVVQAVVSGVKALVDAVFALAKTLMSVLQSALNEAWDIPVISELYSWITGGSTLTTLDLISLVVAVPVTFTYKIIYQKAPFADSGSVDDFKNSFGSATMLQASGLGGSTNKKASKLTSRLQVSKEAETFLLITSTLSTIIGGWVTAVNDAFPKEAPPMLSKVSWVLNCAGQISSFPWFTSSGAPSCDPTDQAGAQKTLWIFQNVGIIMDTVFIAIEDRMPENTNDAGVVVQFIYSIVHLDLAIVASEFATGATIAGNILPTIPELSKLLRLSAIVEATSGISLAVLAAIDGICYTATGLIGFIDATSNTRYELAYAK